MAHDYQEKSVVSSNLGIFIHQFTIYHLPFANCLSMKERTRRFARYFFIRNHHSQFTIR